MTSPELKSTETLPTGDITVNVDRRTPRRRKAYVSLWVFMSVCVIFAAMVLFMSA